MLNAGRVIARVYDAYCETRGYAPSLVDSIRKETPGIGQMEKKERRRQRIRAEKAQQLAKSTWEDSGKPEGGPASFLPQAREQLNVIE